MDHIEGGNCHDDVYFGQGLIIYCIVYRLSFIIYQDKFLTMTRISDLSLS